MTDWSPLGGNPVPGDPVYIRSVGVRECVQIADAADDARAAVSQLVAGLAPETWTDANVAHFVASVPEDLLSDLQHLYVGYESVANTLRTYASELEEAQRLAIKANELVREGLANETSSRIGRGRLEDARRGHEGHRNSVLNQLDGVNASLRTLSAQRLSIEAQLRSATDSSVITNLQYRLNGVRRQQTQQLGRRSQLHGELAQVEASLADVDAQLRTCDEQIGSAQRLQQRGRAVADAAKAQRDAAGRKATAAIDAADKSAFGSTWDHVKYRVRTSSVLSDALFFIDNLQSQLINVIAALQMLTFIVALIPGLNVIAPFLGAVLGVLKVVAIGLAVLSLISRSVNFAAGGESGGKFFLGQVGNVADLVGARGTVGSAKNALRAVNNERALATGAAAALKSKNPLTRALYSNTHSDEVFLRRVTARDTTTRLRLLDQPYTAAKALNRPTSIRRINHLTKGIKVGVGIEVGRHIQDGVDVINQVDNWRNGRFSSPSAEPDGEDVRRGTDGTIKLISELSGMLQ